MSTSTITIHYLEGLIWMLVGGLCVGSAWYGVEMAHDREFDRAVLNLLIAEGCDPNGFVTITLQNGLKYTCAPRTGAVKPRKPIVVME